MSVADGELTLNVMLVEWLVKLQQQLSLQQRLPYGATTTAQGTAARN